MSKDINDNPYLDPEGRLELGPAHELTAAAARDEARLLREAIHEHDHRYFVLDAPTISDTAYDRLFRRLQALEETFPELAVADSPTRRVGGRVLASLPEVEHLAPMLSLDSSDDAEKVREFDVRVRRGVGDVEVAYVAEPKFDGLSIEAVYRDGRFERGATRGDGTRGEGVSENLRTIPSLPLVLRSEAAPPPLLSVRGEVYMPLAGFHELNRRRLERGDEPYANPRNAAAGAVRQLDSAVAASRPLALYVYDVLAIGGAKLPDSHWETLGWLVDLGFKVSARRRLCHGIEDAIEFHDEIETERDDLDYEVDGVVVKVDRRDLQDELGMRSRSPRWAFAHKFEPRHEVTAVEDIVLQVGRTGILAPVALLAPVEVGGVTIARASLHNLDQIRQKDVRRGDIVRVSRAGDVIPYVVERVDDRPDGERERPFDMPERCPVCGSRVERDGAYFVCTGGIVCPAQLVGSVAHYASRSALDIEGLGEKTVRGLREAGLIQSSVADLYRLTVDDLLPLDFFAEVKASKLVVAIEASKAPTLGRFLYALGIRHVGEHVSEVLAHHFGAIDALSEAAEEELIQVREVGPEVARSVRDFFREPRNREAIHELLDLGVRPTVADRATIFEGERFVLTGALQRWGRDVLSDLLQSFGARVTSLVSSKTDFVVIGEKPGSKAAKAEALGVPCLDEDGLVGLLRDRGVEID